MNQSTPTEPATGDQRAQWKAQIIRQRMMRINEMPVMKEEGALIGTGASAIPLVFNAAPEVGFFKKALHVQPHGLRFSEALGCIPQGRKRFFVGRDTSFFEGGGFHKVPSPPAFKKHRLVVGNVCQLQAQGFPCAGGADPAKFPACGRGALVLTEFPGKPGEGFPALQARQQRFRRLFDLGFILVKGSQEDVPGFRRSGVLSWSRIKS